MLVLSLNKETKIISGNSRTELHPVWQWLDPERRDKGESESLRSKKMLLEVIADINQYLPDDWRMNSGSSNWRFKEVTDNQFRIELCIYRNDLKSTIRAALIGNSFHVNDNEVLHIVDTVLRPDMFSGPAVETINKEEGYAVLPNQIDGGHKAKNPELLVPNMYYFSPCPDDSPSPLFARQYERIERKGDLINTRQFHRIHPITKVGVDPDHFRWLNWQWNTDKNNVGIRFVMYPREKFRGKTYWGMPRLTDASDRVYDPRIYKRKLLEEFEKGAVKPIPPEPTIFPYETEFKFDVRAGDIRAEKDYQGLIKTVCAKISTTLCECVLESEGTKEQIDTYMDDVQFSLLKAGACFRLRKRDDHVRITLKKRFPETSEEGLYRRIEEEVIIGEEDIKKLEAGCPIHALPYRLIAYVAPGCGPLYKATQVVNKRTTITIYNANRQRAELCFDELHFNPQDCEETTGPFYEVELESKGMPRETLKIIANTIRDIPGLTASNETKYERAMNAIGKLMPTNTTEIE